MSNMVPGRVPHPAPQGGAVPTLPPARPLSLDVEAIARLSLVMQSATERLLELERARQTPPEFHTLFIDGTIGYTKVQRSQWEAKSIGILNPTTVNIILGIGGVTARPTSRAPSCPPQTLMVLPVRAYDLELGCDPAQLLALTAVFYVMRFQAVQPAFMARIT
jgi:hypothetical protein